MAETLKVRVRCHACTYMIEGTAKYGKGHYVPEGLNLWRLERLKHRRGARLRRKFLVFALAVALNVNLLFNIKHFID